MLEEIGVQRAIVQRQIGLHVVVEFDQLDGVTLGLELGHDACLQQVVVGACGGTNAQLLLGSVLGHGRHGECTSHGQHSSSQYSAAASASLQEKAIRHGDSLTNMVTRPWARMPVRTPCTPGKFSDANDRLSVCQYARIKGKP